MFGSLFPSASFRVANPRLEGGAIQLDLVLFWKPQNWHSQSLGRAEFMYLDVPDRKLGSMVRISGL